MCRNPAPAPDGGAPATELRKAETQADAAAMCTAEIVNLLTGFTSFGVDDPATAKGR